jgi:hypothetical protein
MIERTHLVRMTIGVDEETGEPYTKEELVKPLTDEEIKQIFQEQTGYVLDESSMALMDFARAILKKANECA